MMLTLVEQWQQSGMSQTEFAKVHDITLVKLRYWIRRWRQNDNSTSGFIQLNGYSGQDIRIRFPNTEIVCLCSTVKCLPICNLFFAI